MDQPGFYREEEWQASAGHRPLRNIKLERLMTLHRAFLFANRQRHCGDLEMQRIVEAGEDIATHIAGPSVLQGHFYAWYAFLYALIEACLPREIEIRGVFGAEIKAMTKTLKKFRDAVFHVPRSSYYDDRLMALFKSPATGADRLRRVNAGFGRMFLEEFDARKAETERT